MGYDGGWGDPRRASWRRGDGGMELPGLTARSVLWSECQRWCGVWENCHSFHELGWVVI